MNSHVNLWTVVYRRFLLVPCEISESTISAILINYCYNDSISQSPFSEIPSLFDAHTTICRPCPCFLSQTAQLLPWECPSVISLWVMRQADLYWWILSFPLLQQLFLCKMLFLEVNCFWKFYLFLTSFLLAATLPFLDYLRGFWTTGFIDTVFIIIIFIRNNSYILL